VALPWWIVLPVDSDTNLCEYEVLDIMNDVVHREGASCN
jgi:hypothetical protein